FDNHGLIELTSTGSTWSASLIVGSNTNPRTLLNDTDGTISALPGTGGSRTLNANVNNQGTITVADTTTLAVTFGGLTNLSNGTLTGGSYDLQGTFECSHGAVTTNAANLILDGPGWRFVDLTTNRNALDGLTANTPAGALTVTAGAVLGLPSFS